MELLVSLFFILASGTWCYFILRRNRRLEEEYETLCVTNNNTITNLLRGIREANEKAEFNKNVGDALRVEKNGMWERINNADRRCKELSEEVAGLKGAVASYKAEVASYDAANATLADSLDNEMRHGKQAEETIRKLQRENAEKAEIIKNVEGQKDDAYKRFVESAEAHLKTKKALEQAEKKVQEWIKDCTYYRKCFDETEKRLKEMISCREKQIENLVKENRSLVAQVEDYKGKMDTLAKAWRLASSDQAPILASPFGTTRTVLYDAKAKDACQVAEELKAALKKGDMVALPKEVAINCTPQSPSTPDP